ncbi:MAG: DUF3501 family protein [Deltaproteobacteria bacterium]|nr:MAG: DUF3501 family protein [Deltaproteobacteria bacterium]
MQKVRREDIVDFMTWTDVRPVERPKILAIKEPRRVTAGPITVLFENTDTVRYQVQEMMRIERIVRDADIQHEIDTYNELIGGPGELGTVVLIEVDDPEERKDKLRAWTDLPDKLYLELEDGTRVTGLYDGRQIEDGKLSSVQYVRFPVGGHTPVAMGCELDGLSVRTELTEAQREALREDLA